MELASLLLLGLTACATPVSGNSAVTQLKYSTATLLDLGVAPELNNPVWLNTDMPLHHADLHGKVVGLEMWTFRLHQLPARHAVAEEVVRHV